MKEYAFDIKYWATAYVEAETEEQARAKLKEYEVITDVLQADGIEINAQTAEGEADLLEVHEI